MKQIKSSIIIQKYWRGFQQRRNYLKIKKGVILIQTHIRTHLAKLKYKQMLQVRTDAAIIIQSCARMFLAKCEIQKLKENKAAIQIQKTWKMYIKRCTFLHLKAKIIQMQALVRMKRARIAFLKQVANRNQAAILIQSYVRRNVGEWYDSFVRKRALVKYKSQVK